MDCLDLFGIWLLVLSHGWFFLVGMLIGYRKGRRDGGNGGGGPEGESEELPRSSLAAL